MVLVLVLLLIVFILIPPLKINKNGSDYLSKDKTLPVKGLFVFLVFCNHIRRYLILSDTFWIKAIYPLFH